MSTVQQTRRLSRRTIMIGTGAFVAFAAAGLLLGRSYHGSDTAAGDAATAPLAVLQPSGYGPDALPYVPGNEAAYFAGGGAPAADAASGGEADPTAPVVIVPSTPQGSAEVERAGTEATSTTGTDASSETTASSDTTATSETTGEPTLGPPVAAADLPTLEAAADLVVLPPGAGIVQIVDPCADGADGCPDGLGATILPGGREPLVIAEVTAAVTPGRPGIYDECIRGGGIDARSAVLAIISNHPASFTISGHWSGTAATSNRQRERFDADRGRGLSRNVVTCAVINPAGERGEVHVEGTDDLGATDAITTVIDAQPFDHKRPPISVSPTGDMTLDVTVPVRPNETAEVVAVTRVDDTEGASPCVEPRVAHVESTSTQRLVAIPPWLLDNPGYPYDPTWDRIAVVSVTLTEGSTPYDLCVRWLSRQRSFDAPQLIEVETRVLLPPTRNDLRVSVEGVIPGRDQRIDSLRLGIELKAPPGVPRCAIDARAGASFPLEVSPDKYATPVPMCLLHTGATGEWLPAYITYDGVRRETAIRASRRYCHTGNAAIGGCMGDFTEYYQLAIPKEDGSPSGGIVSLRFDYEAPHGPRGSFYTVRDTWSIYGTTVVTPTDADGQNPFGPQPQLDLYTTTVRPDGGSEGRSTLVVQWVADRPVMMTARVEGNDPETCSRDPRPSVSNAVPEASGTLRLQGLCAGTRSQVGLTLTGADGRTSTYSDIEGAHADRVGPGFTATTDGIPVVFSPAILFGSDLSALAPGTVARTASSFMRVNGEIAVYANLMQDFSATGRMPRLDLLPCASVAAYRWTPTTYVGTDASRPRPPAIQTGVWPEDVHLALYSVIDLGTAPCAEPNGNYLSFDDIRYYELHDFVVTTAGPDSVLVTPTAAHGPADAPPALVVQLNARPG